MSYAAGQDLCLSFWAKAMESGWIYFPPNARVLEIGCAEADWQGPMLALRPDLGILGIDWRACERPGVTIQGDVLRHEFPAASFDAIVSISAIEHIGLGAYDDDPLCESGDVRAMSNAHLWLKRGGWVYLDVPYSDECFSVYPNYRRYNEQALQARILPGFVVKKHAKCITDHPDGPYMALLLEKA